MLDASAQAVPARLPGTDTLPRFAESRGSIRALSDAVLDYEMAYIAQRQRQYLG